MHATQVRNQYPQGREPYWDNIKGILIVLVVFAHFLFDLQSSLVVDRLVDAIYFFHMPAFVFVSGYFSKSAHSRSMESLLKLFSAYIFLHAWFILSSVSPAGSVKLLSSYYSEWYLMALIAWRLTVPLLAEFRGILPLSIVFAVLIGFFPDAGGTEVLALNKVLTFLPFFVAGYLFPVESVERIRRHSRFLKALVCTVSIAISAGIIYLGKTQLQINDYALLAYGYQSVSLVEPVSRLAIFAVSALALIFLLNASPKKRIPMLTNIGKNSLAIYLLHRPFTLLFYEPVRSFPPSVQIALAAAATMVLVNVLGADIVAGAVNGLLDRAVALLSHSKRIFKNQHLFRTFFYTILCLMMVFPVAISLLTNLNQLWPLGTAKTTSNAPVSDEGFGPIAETDPIYRVMEPDTKRRFDDAFHLLFAGDLILLEDQVRNAYNGDGYDFSDCFEFTKGYITSADYAIGVFEGPMGGTTRNYSSSNFDDGKELYLNFPDEWGQAVREAGFDLVTTANNHALDMGTEGLLRTQDVLESMGLDYTGTYRDLQSKEQRHVKIVERDGIRMAFLSYTMFMNNTAEETLVNGDLSWATSMIVPESSANYEKVRADIQRDFEKAKAYEPDLIIALPHWGTQFNDYPDGDQLAWEENFRSYGADIILGDHTHTVQPVRMKGNTLTLFCPGNYANIYRNHNGDCSALVEVYIDRQSKKVIGGAIVPMWTASSYKGNYRPIPIYEILTDPKLGAQITTYDMERVEAVHRHITGVMLRHYMRLNMIQQRYYFDAQGFMRVKTPRLELNDEMKGSTVYKLMKAADRICFVGDSVTEGTKNGGVPWYEPLEDLTDAQIVNCGWGGATTKTILQEHMADITGSNADLFVIAIGTNDVRYRNDECAMTPEEYTENLASLRATIIDKNPNASFIFIAPWTSTDGDRVSALNYLEKTALNSKYTTALEKWTATTGDLFVNANHNIDAVLNVYPQSDYLIDYIHPNATKGVKLYAEAFLRG